MTNKKLLINHLRLAYCPLCNYDFTSVKKDPLIQSALEESSLYVIAQRPEIRFDNLIFDEKERIVSFEIRQKNNPNVLKCSFPIFQEHIATNFNKEVLASLGSHLNTTLPTSPPFNDIHGIKFFQGNLNPENFLIWFSPEKFLQNYWKGYLEAKIEGDILSFTKYKVHYVGQSIKQDVWKRLTGHSTLQDIISLEYPFSFDTLPTHEIAIIFFNLEESIQMHTFGRGNEDIQDMVDSVMGRNLPEKDRIFLDAEKALINALQPKYNKQLFKSYPKSDDGLYNHKFDSISYSLLDPISLVYEEGEICGNQQYYDGDQIFVPREGPVELVKNKNA